MLEEYRADWGCQEESRVRVELSTASFVVRRRRGHVSGDGGSRVDVAAVLHVKRRTASERRRGGAGATAEDWSSVNLT